MPRRPKGQLLLPREVRFVEHYLVHLNLTRAAAEAGYSARTAREQGVEIYARPAVRAAIDQAMKRRSQRVEIKQDDVLRQLSGILAADPNALSQFRRHCCRYCWGEGFRYQRTPGELERDREAHAEKVSAARKAGKPLRGAAAKFDEKGGIGYDKRGAPNGKCPECFGDGVGEVFLTDTRDLTPGQLALYAGAKRTKDGIEVKTHDKVAVITLIMRHLGMLQDKVDHTNKGKPFDSTPATLNLTIGGQ